MAVKCAGCRSPYVKTGLHEYQCPECGGKTINGEYIEPHTPADGVTTVRHMNVA